MHEILLQIKDDKVYNNVLSFLKLLPEDVIKIEIPELVPTEEELKRWNKASDDYKKGNRKDFISLEEVEDSCTK